MLNEEKNNESAEEIQENKLDDIVIERDTSDAVVLQNIKKPSFLSSLFDYVEVFIVAICAVILIFSFAIRLCKVEGPSMEKTLIADEMLVVSNLFYTPERGDIIVFHQTGTLNEPIVKRVIATEGEIIDIDFDTWTVTITDTDGNTFVLDEPYMYLDGGTATITSRHAYPYTVPEGCLFVMGDNRNHSTDSRGHTIGMVDERRVLGKVVFRITPIDKIGTVD